MDDGVDAHRLALFGISLMAGFQQTCDPRDRDLLRAMFDDYQRLILSYAPAHVGDVTRPIG